MALYGLSCETGNRPVRLMHFGLSAMEKKQQLRFVFATITGETSRIEPVYSSSIFFFKQWRRGALAKKHTCVLRTAQIGDRTFLGYYGCIAFSVFMKK
jgi:hypothetical protein